MLLTRFDPFREMREYEKKLYDKNYKESAITGFTPSVNTREGEFAYHLEMDIPGVSKEDINIDIDGNVLKITGERSTKEEVKEDDYYKIESSFGKFQRSFTLPESVDLENITANSKAGVLEVVIPKMEAKKETKRIEIK